MSNAERMNELYFKAWKIYIQFFNPDEWLLGKELEEWKKFKKNKEK